MASNINMRGLGVSIGARSMAPEFGKPIHQLPLIPANTASCA
jgi:hypothetical protein